MTYASFVRRLRAPSAALALIAPSLCAQASKAPARICLAPAAVQMVGGNAADGTAAVRETLTSLLTGPTLTVAPLTSRLSSQIREEARQGACSYVAFVSLKHERKQSGGGLFGRIVSGAVESGAYELRGRAGSAATRVVASAAASAAAEAAHNFAANVKTRDELTVDYRLESGDGGIVVKNSEKAKASSDGQDLLTPVLERAAEAMAGAATR